MKTRCTRIFTGLITSNRDGDEIAAEVDEVINDHDGATVQWFQSPTYVVSRVGEIMETPAEGPVRMTAVITWTEEDVDENPPSSA